MNTPILEAASPSTSRYWLELQGLSNNEKLELIMLLSGSLMSPSAANSTDETARDGHFSINQREEDNARLNAFLEAISGDWGGDATPAEIACELRQGADMVRDVNTW